MSTKDIDPKLVMELRKRTGLAVLECRKALIYTGGDIDAAEKYLRSVGATYYNLRGIKRLFGKLPPN